MKSYQSADLSIARAPHLFSPLPLSLFLLFDTYSISMRLQINIATRIGLSIPLLLFVNDQRGLLHTHESLGGWTANTNSSSSSSSSTSSSSRITNQRVTCDSDPCEGEFKYDGPATDPIQAVELYHQALEKYSYGGQRG